MQENVPIRETIGFIGLGGMGVAIATNLLRAGFALRVYNRTAEKARSLLEYGAALVRSPATVAKGRENSDWAGFARKVSESAGL